MQNFGPKMGGGDVCPKMGLSLYPELYGICIKQPGGPVNFPNTDIDALVVASLVGLGSGFASRT